MFAPAVMFMIPKSEIPIQVLLPEHPGKMYPKTGYAPLAVLEKTLLKKNNNTKINGTVFIYSTIQS